MLDRVTFDPHVMGGRACIRGMRITVSLLVNLVANGMSTEAILAEYPDLEAEDVRQALQYAALLSREEGRVGQVLGARSRDLEAGALVVVEDTRDRIRRLPIE